MTGAERGWLLLCADLGDGVKPLSPAQVRSLRMQLRQSRLPADDPDRALTVSDLRAIGCDQGGAQRILSLLDRGRSLDLYLKAGSDYGIFPLTRSSPEYPSMLLRLGNRAPGVLFCRGNPELLRKKAVCLTGCRNLSEKGAAFAAHVGRLAASEDYVLVSGNARGADRTAQDACLASGGSVISVLPGPLYEQSPASERQLLICEDGWHLPFSSYRALNRNRLIYALAQIALIAEIGNHGGTMHGAAEALRFGLGPVFVRKESGPGYQELLQLGADSAEDSFSSFKCLSPTKIPMDIAGLSPGMITG